MSMWSNPRAASPHVMRAQDVFHHMFISHLLMNTWWSSGAQESDRAAEVV